MLRPVLPTMNVPPETLSVPVVTPVMPATVVLRRSARMTEVASNVPALMLTAAVKEPPSAPVRPPMASVLARMSTVWPVKSTVEVGVAPVAELL